MEKSHRPKNPVEPGTAGITGLLHSEEDLFGYEFIKDIPSERSAPLNSSVNIPKNEQLEKNDGGEDDPEVYTLTATQMAELQEQNEQQESQIARLRTELAASQEAVAELEEEVEILKQEYVEQLDEQQNRLQAQMELTDTFETQIRQVESQQQIDLAENKEAKQKLEVELEQTEEELKHVLKIHEATKSKNEFLQQLVDDLRLQVKALESEQKPSREGSLNNSGRSEEHESKLLLQARESFDQKVNKLQESHKAEKDEVLADRDHWRKEAQNEAVLRYQEKDRVKLLEKQIADLKDRHEKKLQKIQLKAVEERVENGGEGLVEEIIKASRLPQSMNNSLIDLEPASGVLKPSSVKSREQSPVQSQIEPVFPLEKSFLPSSNEVMDEPEEELVDLSQNPLLPEHKPFEDDQAESPKVSLKASNFQRLTLNAGTAPTETDRDTIVSGGPKTKRRNIFERSYTKHQKSRVHQKLQELVELLRSSDSTEIALDEDDEELLRELLRPDEDYEAKLSLVVDRFILYFGEAVEEIRDLRRDVQEQEWINKELRASIEKKIRTNRSLKLQLQAGGSHSLLIDTPRTGGSNEVPKLSEQGPPQRTAFQQIISSIFEP